ncbi:MAG: DUF6259 domain-containing protein [Acidobacteriota bacterium]
MRDRRELSRRRFLSAAGATAAASSCLPLVGATILASEPEPLRAQTAIAASREQTAAEPLIVSNSGYRLLIDPRLGSIDSFKSTFGVERDLLIPNHASIPLFKIELLDDHRAFKTITSSQAKSVEIHHSNSGGPNDEQTLVLEFKDIAGLPIHARVTARCPANETLTYWSLEVTNGTTSWLSHVQFPCIEVPFDDVAKSESSHILSSFLDGIVTGPVGPTMGTGTVHWTRPARNTPETWRYNNYPGRLITTQLLAYYNDFGGLYLACDDATGLPKFINPLMEDSGVTLGLGHYPGTRGPGTMKLPYNVVLGTFHGDWYAAAEIYRDWACKQSFCSSKIAQRKDMPSWMADSPIAFMFPMRGQGDWDPPAAVNPEYTPVTNALPYLDKLATELESPLMPIVFNWEHAGPWVQPDAFPPLGGDAPMKEFMAKARAKGWHPVIYGDGVNWTTAQHNTKYDGMPYFKAHGGEQAAVQRWDGSLAHGVGAWRDNYQACVGTKEGREMILGMTRGMAEFGPEVIQQFDQGAGPSACYAANHEHPPCPGPWQIEHFKQLLAKDAEAARAHNPATVMSCEGAPPECYLQDFQTFDSRIEVSNCPLHSFIYHEYANGFQGCYTNRVNDEALRLSVARALVTGYMFCFTLRDQGRIEYDWDQLWTRAVPDQVAILDWAKRANQLRAGIARDYLIFGRMQRPYKVNKVTQRDFGWGLEPLVQSATWKAQDGRIGVVLANYADLGETPQVELEGTGKKHLSLYLDGDHTEREVELPHVLNLNMQPRSLCLIELK